MHWIAPTERDTATDTLEKRLWNAADQFRANSGLTAAQYSAPVLGLIFLLFAETRFAKRRTALLPSPAGGGGVGGEGRRSSNRADDPSAYHAEGVIFLPETARFAHLLNLPEGANVGQAINDAMAEIERHNPQLAGVLPRTFQIFTSTLLKELLKKVSEIPVSLDYDAFDRIYEYFLGEFARPEWLANAHRELDAAVATTYGWMDYTPEMPDEEILRRLLALNLQRSGSDETSYLLRSPRNAKRLMASIEQMVVKNTP
jgi:type I restriction enzyme M protein